LEISIEIIKDLRNQCGAGVMECRNALLEAKGDIGKALQLLKEKGLLTAEKKASRVTTQGLVEAYVHTGGRIAAMIEVNCETDFVARTDEFKELAHDLAMQVAALSPQYVSEEELPEGADVEPQAACLLQQPARTVRDMIVEVIARVGENIRVSRFTRYELGTGTESNG
jgi:elongation factor Ts